MGSTPENLWQRITEFYEARGKEQNVDAAYKRFFWPFITTNKLIYLGNKDGIFAEDSANDVSIEDYDALIAKYGHDGLRLYADEERLWWALCNHAPDPTKCPGKEWLILRHVARGRANGMDQVELGNIPGIEKKSMTGRRENLVRKGYIQAKAVTAGRSRTYLLTATRFLRKDGEQGNEEEVGEIIRTSGSGATSIDTDNLTKAIFGVLERERGGIMRYFHLKQQLNFNRPVEVVGKTLPRLIRRLCTRGYLQRALVPMDDTGRNYTKIVKMLKTYEEYVTSDEMPIDSGSTFNDNNDNGEVDEGEMNAEEEEDEVDDVEEGKISTELSDAVMGKAEVIEEKGFVARVPRDMTIENYISYYVEACGIDGVHGPDVIKNITGQSFRRPLDELLKRMTDGKLKTPPHVSHRALEGSLEREGRTGRFRYWTRPYMLPFFARLDIPPPPGKHVFLDDDKDAWGHFPAIPESCFVKVGKPIYDPTRYAVSYRPAHASKRKHDEDSNPNPNSDDDDAATRVKPKGRPRKYAPDLKKAVRGTRGKWDRSLTKAQRDAQKRENAKQMRKDIANGRGEGVGVSATDRPTTGESAEGSCSSGAVQSDATAAATHSGPKVTIRTSAPALANIALRTPAIRTRVIVTVPSATTPVAPAEPASAVTTDSESAPAPVKVKVEPRTPTVAAGRTRGRPRKAAAATPTPAQEDTPAEDVATPTIVAPNTAQRKRPVAPEAEVATPTRRSKRGKTTAATTATEIPETPFGGRTPTTRSRLGTPVSMLARNTGASKSAAFMAAFLKKGGTASSSQPEAQMAETVANDEGFAAGTDIPMEVDTPTEAPDGEVTSAGSPPVDSVPGEVGSATEPLEAPVTAVQAASADQEPAVDEAAADPQTSQASIESSTPVPATPGTPATGERQTPLHESEGRSRRFVHYHNRNVAALIRQRNMLKFLQAEGGLLDCTYSLAKHVDEWFKVNDPGNYTGHSLDRKTTDNTWRQLRDQGKVNIITFIARDHLGREVVKKLVTLAEIDANSPQVLAYREKITEKAATKRVIIHVPQVELQVEDVDDDMRKSLLETRVHKSVPKSRKRRDASNGDFIIHPLSGEEALHAAQRLAAKAQDQDKRRRRRRRVEPNQLARSLLQNMTVGEGGAPKPRRPRKRTTKEPNMGGRISLRHRLVQIDDEDTEAFEESNLDHDFAEVDDLDKLKARRRRRDVHPMQEDDDLLRAVCIVRELFGGKARLIDWNIVEKIWPHHTQEYIRLYYNAKRDNPRWKLCRELHASRWPVCYERGIQLGLIPRVEESDDSNFDIREFVEFFKTNEITADANPNVPELPEDLDALFSMYDIETTRLKEEKQWQDGHMYVVASTRRRDDMASHAWYAGIEDEPSLSEGDEDDLVEKSKGLMKSILVTPDTDYDYAAAADLLKTVPEDILDTALTQMLKGKVIVKKATEYDRVLPGRNFILADRFLQALKHPYPEKTFRQAAAFEVTLRKGLLEGSKGMAVSLLANNGSIAAILELIADKRVTLQPLEEDRIGVIRGWSNDGISRMMDRRHLEFPILVVPTDRFFTADGVRAVSTTAATSEDAFASTSQEIGRRTWINIHGKRIEHIWSTWVSAVLATAMARPGLSQAAMLKALHPAVMPGELRDIWDFLVKKGMAIGVEESGGGYVVKNCFAGLV
ncbi:hypothetical protein YB2330_000541 [Saitoella coloradoensis]